MRTATRTSETEAIRRELRGWKAGPGRRYAPELRRRVVRWAEGRVAAGVAPEEAAADLGLRAETLARWLHRGVPEEAQVHALVPVHVSPGEPSRVVLVSPAGFRVEGLSVEEAAALLRALG